MMPTLSTSNSNGINTASANLFKQNAIAGLPVLNKTEVEVVRAALEKAYKLPAFRSPAGKAVSALKQPPSLVGALKMLGKGSLLLLAPLLLTSDANLNWAKLTGQIPSYVTQHDLRDADAALSIFTQNENLCKGFTPDQTGRMIVGAAQLIRLLRSKAISKDSFLNAMQMLYDQVNTGKPAPQVALQPSKPKTSETPPSVVPKVPQLPVLQDAQRPVPGVAPLPNTPKTVPTVPDIPNIVPKKPEKPLTKIGKELKRLYDNLQNNFGSEVVSKIAKRSGVSEGAIRAEQARSGCSAQEAANRISGVKYAPGTGGTPSVPTRQLTAADKAAIKALAEVIAKAPIADVQAFVSSLSAYEQQNLPGVLRTAITNRLRGADRTPAWEAFPPLNTGPNWRVDKLDAEARANNTPTVAQKAEAFKNGGIRDALKKIGFSDGVIKAIDCSPFATNLLAEHFATGGKVEIDKVTEPGVAGFYASDKHKIVVSTESMAKGGEYDLLYLLIHEAQHSNDFSHLKSVDTTSGGGLPRSRYTETNARIAELLVYFDLSNVYKGIKPPQTFFDGTIANNKSVAQIKKAWNKNKDIKEVFKTVYGLQKNSVFYNNYEIQHLNKNLSINKTELIQALKAYGIVKNIKNDADFEKFKSTISLLDVQTPENIAYLLSLFGPEGKYEMPVKYMPKFADFLNSLSIEYLEEAVKTKPHLDTIVTIVQHVNNETIVGAGKGDVPLLNWLKAYCATEQGKRLGARPEIQKILNQKP